MATIRRGARGTAHPVADLRVTLGAVHIRSANGNIDHQLLFDGIDEQRAFAHQLLIAVGDFTPAQAGAAAHGKPPSEIFKLAGTQTGRTQSATPNFTSVARHPTTDEVATGKLNEKDVYGTGTGQHYLEAKEPNEGGGGWCYLIYTYDPTGEHEQIRHRSGFIYRNKAEAIDAGVAWADTTGLDVEIM